MLCCASCRQSSDPSAERSLTKDADSAKKDKEFSDDVVVASQPVPSPSAPQPAQQPLLAAEASHNIKIPENKIQKSLPVTSQAVNSMLSEPVGAALKSGLNPNLTNPSGPGNQVSVAATPMATLVKEETLLKEIDKLSEVIEKAAAGSQRTGVETASVYANQLKALTSQVRKEASNMSESALQMSVARLEAVAARLESLASAQSGRSSVAGESDEVPQSVIAFDELLNGPLATFLEKSSAIGGDVQTQAKLVASAFQAQRQFLLAASKSKQPPQSVLLQLIDPCAKQLSAIQEFRENNRRSEFFNHLSAVSESIAALGWITVTPAPGPYVKEMTDAGTFYTNRVLKDFKDKNPHHVDWARSWISALTELQAYIKQYHTTGVTWNPRGGDATTSAATPRPAAAAGSAPPPPPPPPPPPADKGGQGSGGDDSRAALFAELNKGNAVTQGLRKVTDDMKTHKNPGLRQGPAPFKAAAPKPTPSAKPAPAAKAKAERPPLTELQNKKWVVEFHEGNKMIVLDQTDLKQTVYVYKCNDCVVQVKGKVNSITLDSCKKTAVVFDDVVSSLEFVNCQSMQAQVLGKVPTISIDKTDGCMVYLSSQSLSAEIVTAKSSEMNVLVPTGDGDFKEFALPEQFKTTWNGREMLTVQTDI